MLFIWTLNEVDDECFCENNSAVDSNNQELSKPWDSNLAPPNESNMESSIISKNGGTIPTSHSNISPTFTPKNPNNQSYVGDLGNSAPILHRLERIWKSPLYIQDYSL